MIFVKNRLESDIGVISSEVRAALEEKRPVVALESTIISHGMPYPRNIETALRVEEIIRKKGAVPATIAVIQGKIRVGLSSDDLELLGRKSSNSSILKLSSRDLPYALAQRASGATTVAGTLFCAGLAGIRVFATGGIGGVHRGGEKTLDISADLHELARTPVAVVSAGVKSILDIGLTLEVLESLAVPVLMYQTDSFPSFFSRESSFKSDYRLDHVTEIAEVVRAQFRLGFSGLGGGVLVANPIPKEFELPAVQVDAIIQEALNEADAQGIRGKQITPFLLAAIHEKSQGKSLAANIALVENNAALAASLAQALSTSAF